MLDFRLHLTASLKKQLEDSLTLAHQLGRFKECQRLRAISAVAAGHPISTVAAVLHVTSETVRSWLARFLAGGLTALKRKRATGRPPKLTKKQKQELAALIEAGPQQAGFAGACWRSPMIQQLVTDRWQVSYSVHYIAELLKSLGFSFQKARFISDQPNEQKRQDWLTHTWPEILRLARGTKAYLLFGDEASFPQWGTLSYTWARRGAQPVVKTCGRRKSYKVFGLIDYFTGRLFSKCQEGRLTSETYQAFLCDVLTRTRKPLIIIQDGAKYHTSRSTREFFARRADRVTVYDLPSYSPDYNPIEKLWKKIKEGETHLHYFPTFESLMTRVKEAMVKFEQTPEAVLSLFGFYRELAVA